MRQFIKYLFSILLLIFVALLLVGSLNSSFQNQARVTIKAKASQVFAIYNNPLLMNHWIKDFQSIEKTQGKLNQVGSKWLIHFKSKTKDPVTLEKTLTAYQAQKLLKFDYENSWLSGQEGISFERQSPTSTIVTVSQNFSGSSVFKNAFFYFMQDGVAQANQNSLERFKKLVEESQAVFVLEDLETDPFAEDEQN